MKVQKFIRLTDEVCKKYGAQPRCENNVDCPLYKHNCGALDGSTTLFEVKQVVKLLKKLKRKGEIG